MAGHSPARFAELQAAVTAARAQFDAAKAAQPDNLAEVLAGVEENPVQIPSRDGGRAIEARLYRSTAAKDAAAASSSGPSPVLVNWHGSGMVFHMFGQDRPFCAQMARDLPGLVVVDADYRKGPEDPFPAAMHDVEDALRWVAAQPDVYDVARVALSGFSAGGLLALVASSSFRQTFATSDDALKQMQIPPRRRRLPAHGPLRPPRGPPAGREARPAHPAADGCAVRRVLHARPGGAQGPARLAGARRRRTVSRARRHRHVRGATTARPRRTSWRAN
ncbi:esterase/lipase [Apiospora aurea]|uniref:Esterase/lipase n=1 Tax=Apiospora aurea TaxID=335848 RepID=A0ABR1QLV9_9PEZI